MNWNVKGASQEALDYIDTLKKERNLSSSEVLDFLVKAVTQQNQGGNPETEQKLTEVTQQLEEVTRERDQVTQQLTDYKTSGELLVAQLSERDHTISQLQEKISEIEMVRPHPLTENQFILTIKGASAPQVLKAIKEDFYRKGYTKNTDQEQYNNEVFNYAFRYLAQNEFPKHVPA